ncbi:hypothetical protein HDU97_006290, partial [Phlyctochytrium planicorne]
MRQSWHERYSHSALGQTTFTNSYGTKEDRLWPYIFNLLTGGRWAPVKTENNKKVAECNITAETGYVHPAVRRISGCHSNDVENTAGLVLLGLFYVVASKPNAAEAKRIFWTLVAARYIVIELDPRGLSLFFETPDL